MEKIIDRLLSEENKKAGKEGKKEEEEEARRLDNERWWKRVKKEVGLKALRGKEKMRKEEGGGREGRAGRRAAGMEGIHINTTNHNTPNRAQPQQKCFARPCASHGRALPQTGDKHAIHHIASMEHIHRSRQA